MCKTELLWGTAEIDTLNLYFHLKFFKKNSCMPFQKKGTVLISMIYALFSRKPNTP